MTSPLISTIYSVATATSKSTITLARATSSSIISLYNDWKSEQNEDEVAELSIKQAKLRSKIRIIIVATLILTVAAELIQLL